MAEVTIYTRFLCSYCYRAKALLKSKGVAFTEIHVDMNPGARAQMRARSGGRTTLPQIFINGHYVGDCDGLYALDAQGRLDRLLAEAG